jgi:vancomycin permeability regulator SanA
LLGCLRRIVTFALVLLVAAVVLPGAWAYVRYQSRVYGDASSVPAAPVAIVFGAGLQTNGEPSPLLAHRLDAAIALYKRGKVQTLLMSGDNRSRNYDEPGAMRRYAVARGVPADRITLDRYGLRTYDSAYRARNVFGVTRAVLVTQRYHMARALYLANMLGIDADGYVAGHSSYDQQEYYEAREAAALVETWYEVHVLRPPPAFAG